MLDIIYGSVDGSTCMIKMKIGKKIDKCTAIHLCVSVEQLEKLIRDMTETNAKEKVFLEIKLID